MKKLLVLLSLVLLAFSAQSQQVFFTGGRVSDGETKAPLEGAYVTMFALPDTTNGTTKLSEASGRFSFTGLQPGKYLLRIRFMSFDTFQKEFEIADKPVFQGEISLMPSSKKIADVNVNGIATRQEQKGDTTVFHADAFKVNTQATTEDLVKKMPGITVDNTGSVTAHGETVKKVLVDGKEFFGDDPSMTLKNLPADVVDKIEVYNKMSDQSEFTGFDDGNSSKTLNIVTRRGMNNGWFGNMYAGYGSDDRYTAGGAVHRFQGNQRFSVLGMFNNINQQNFSMQDLMAASGGGGGGGRGGGGRDGMFSQQSGITTTNAVGFNYTNTWKEKVKLSTSYFLTYSKNKNTSALEQDYYAAEGFSKIYAQNSQSSNNNLNHRFSLRTEITLDTMNSMIINGRFNLQAKKTDGITDGTNGLLSQTGGGLTTNSSTYNMNNSDQGANNFNGNILFRHKFAKKSRTISMNLGGSGNQRNGYSSLYSQSMLFTRFDTVDTRSDLNYDGISGNANVSYTEPIGKKSILQFSYGPGWNKNNADKNTNDFNPVFEQYNIENDSLSNKYTNNYITQNGGASYRFRNDKVNFSAGVNYQNSNLTGTQTKPSKFKTDKTFESILPTAELNVKFSKSTNLRLSYNTNANAPTVNQLQPVVDNSNQLYLTSGNKDLRQDYSQSIRLRFFTNNMVTSRTFSMFLMSSFTNDYIGNSTITAANDMTVDNYSLKKGAQYTRPENMNGYANVRSFLTYGFPFKAIKCNLNLTSGLSYSKTPGLINGAKNIASTSGLSGGLVIGSNISQNVDFTLMYNINYNIVDNSIMKQSDNNYYNQTAFASANITVLKSVVLSSDINYNKYTGLSAAYSQEYFLWNAGIGYKFLKGKGELKLKAYDILKQNRSINRSVTEMYIQDQQTLVLQNYYMLTFTYTIRALQQQQGPGGGGGFRPPFEHNH